MEATYHRNKPVAVMLSLLLADINRIEAISFAEECRLYDQWKAGDGAARTALATAYLPWVLRIARNYRRQPFPLLDLVQEGAVGLLGAIDADAYDPRRRRLSKCSYFQINDAIHDVVRPRRKPRPSEASLDDGDLQLKNVLPSDADPVRDAMRSEAAQILHAAVDDLPSPLGTVIRLHYFEGLALADIDRSLGFTRGMAWKYHGRGLRRLAGSLAGVLEDEP